VSIWDLVAAVTRWRLLPCPATEIGSGRVLARPQASATMTTTTRHHADEHRPKRPIHVVTVNGAVVVTVSGGHSLGVSPAVEVGFTPFAQLRG
jgi:hypothetical protein